MSLQWTIIATILYVEIAVVLLLVSTVASPQRWHKIINSRFLRALSNQASFYFLILFAMLSLSFLDAIRDMTKYSSQETTEATHAHLDAEMQVNMRLFRSQSNLHISGFALFLSLVIRELVTLISQQAQSLAALRQVRSAMATTRSLLAQYQTSMAQYDTNEILNMAETELKEKLAKGEKALEWEKKYGEALKNQIESVNKEFCKLQAMIDAGGEPKKYGEALDNQMESVNKEYFKLQAMIDAGGEPKKDA